MSNICAVRVFVDTDFKTERNIIKLCFSSFPAYINSHIAVKLLLSTTSWLKLKHFFFALIYIGLRCLISSLCDQSDDTFLKEGWLDNWAYVECDYDICDDLLKSLI